MRNININSKTPCADIKLCMDEWQEEHDRLCREIREARENRDRAKREARYLDSLSITLANELNVLKNPPLVAVPEILNEEEIEWVENSPSPSTVKVPSLPDVEPTPSPAVERVPSSPAVEIPPATTVEEAVGLTNPLECQVCRKTFASCGSLIRHQKLDIGEKPIVCKRCPMSYTRKDHLNWHYTNHHGRVVKKTNKKK